MIPLARHGTHDVRAGSAARIRACLSAAIVLALAASCFKPVPTALPEVPLEHLDLSQATLIRTAHASALQQPESADAWGRLGQTLHAAEFHAAAQTCYQHAAMLDARSPRWPYLLGWLQLQDLSESALANLTRAATLADGNPDTPRLTLARALVERGRWDEARTHLNRLLESNPGHAAARLEWARIQLAHQELAAAADSLAPALTNTHTVRPAILLLSQIRARQGQSEDAATLARRAASMPRSFDWPDPYLREVLRLRADRPKLEDHVNGLLMSGRLAEAAGPLDNLLAAFPEDSEALLLLGRLRYQERRCDDAEAAFRRYLDARPGSLNGLTQLALALLCQQRWTDAATVLEEAIRIKPDFAQAHYNLGLARDRAGNPTGAIQSYRASLRCHPGDTDTHVALADALFRTGDREAAGEHLTRALALDPNHAKAARLRERVSSPP
jgi:tetratricopeptide (TPR) repeat protein